MMKSEEEQPEFKQQQDCDYTDAELQQWGDPETNWFAVEDANSKTSLHSNRLVHTPSK